MSIKFTDTQLAMMRAAAHRHDLCFPPSPALKGSAAQKVAAKLIATNLAKEIKAKAGTPVWRRDAEGEQPLALKLTAAGLKVVAATEETEQTIEGSEPASPKAIVGSARCSAAANPKYPNGARPRESSKLAQVVTMLRREEGATIGDLTAATGWLPHTTRAAITGLRKRGYSVIRERSEDRGSAYRISDGPAGHSDALPNASDYSVGRPRRMQAKQAA